MSCQGFTVAEIAPLDELVADIDLIGPELARVEVGLEARIRHYAFEESFAGEVIRLSPMLDPNKHTFRAEVAVANDERLLRPGMFVEVIVVVEQRPDVVVVPRDAIANRAGNPVAFVLDGQRVSEPEVSALGLGDDDQVQVLDGVARGRPGRGAGSGDLDRRLADPGRRQLNGRFAWPLERR